MANIITTVGAENNVRMTNAQFARQPIASVFSSWATLRICLRMRVGDTGANISGPPNFGVGLCAGSTNILGDATTDHFAGVMSDNVNQSNWPRSATTSVNYTGWFLCAKKVSTTVTQGSNISTAMAIFHTARYKLFFVTITKGIPSYTFNLFAPNAVADVDATNADFLAQAVATTPVLANHGNGTPRTLLVDESVNGTFTHVCLWWNQIGSSVDIADLQVFKVA